MGYLQGAGITQEQPHHWKAHLIQGMTPEPLKLWSSLLSLQTTPQSEQICYRNLAAQHLRPEHWSLHFILLGRNLKNLSRHWSLGHCGICLLPDIHFKFVSLLFHLGTNVEFDGTCQTMLHLYTLKSHLSFLSFFLSSPSLSPLSLILWK